MKTAATHTTLAVAAAVVALAGASLALERAADPAFPTWIATAYAQEHSGGPGGSGETGGHDSGSESGGHDSGGGSSGHGMGGGHGGGGMGGGHEPGAETGGEEAKGHGTRYQHQGHGSGRHGNTSSHESGADRFGGGSGLRGNAQVPEGIGRYGAGISAAAASSDQGRFRYWGGWTLPSDPNEPSFTEPTVTSTELTPGPGGGPSVNVRSALDTSPRCEGVAPGMPAARQLGGSNLLRLNQARALVDPSLAKSGRIASPYIMANLQEQLVRGTPSTELAGTYLGLVAKSPVTAETVKKVGFHLCARISDAGAKEIARVAEQQRMTLVSALKSGGGSGNAKRP